MAVFIGQNVWHWPCKLPVKISKCTKCYFFHWIPRYSLDLSEIMLDNMDHRVLNKLSLLAWVTAKCPIHIHRNGQIYVNEVIHVMSSKLYSRFHSKIFKMKTERMNWNIFTGALRLLDVIIKVQLSESALYVT